MPISLKITNTGSSSQDFIPAGGGVLHMTEGQVIAVRLDSDGALDELQFASNALNFFGGASPSSRFAGAGSGSTNFRQYDADGSGRQLLFIEAAIVEGVGAGSTVTYANNIDSKE